MNRWQRKSLTEYLDWFLIMAVLVAIIALAWVAIARAEACLSIDVPPGAVTKVYDGDTFTLFTFGPGGDVDIRVDGIDTPERKTKQPGWEEAREFTRKWLSLGMFHVETCGDHTLTRIVGEVSRGSETLATALKLAGHEKKEP